MENTGSCKETAEELFFKFMDAEDCPEITHTFRRLVKVLGIKTNNPREFYSLLKRKLQTWRCKSLWEQLDCRANQKEYGKGKICEDIQVLVIGSGPVGLRTAIEVALLGAQVVIVEKRESFVRNNVLHLWPFLLTDFRSLGAKKFYGKFCSGSIDHISIRRLQAILLKCALIFGVKLYTGVTFEHVIEPNSPEDGWKSKVSPDNHPVSTYEFDVLIGADGKKNILPGFQQIEMRGTLAIGITANFVNHGTEEEANVEEISGIAYQFNPQFFDNLLAQKGIKLENIVYYKDETHYFVMTAGKASLLKRGALKEDFGQPAKLLAPCNIDHSKLLEYVTDVVKYSTKGTLKNLELKILGNNQPDIAAFDFTSIKKAEHAARIIERKGSKLLLGLVGDSLLEPFWPTGSGCARGVLSALDAAWMIRTFAQDKPPLQILSERENIYRLLSGTSPENLHKDHAKYTINPNSRYLQITHKKVREVYHLYDTDDAVNADFSLGSPPADVSDKASRRRRISTGAKFTSAKGRKRGRGSSHLIPETGETRLRLTSGSSSENFDEHKPLSVSRSVPLEGQMRSNAAFSSAGSDDEVLDKKTRRVRANFRASPSTIRERSSTVGSPAEVRKGKRKKSPRKKTSSKENLNNPKDETRKKRSFFGFGKSKSKNSANEESDDHSDKERKLFKTKHGEEKTGPRQDFPRGDSREREPAGPLSREQYTRRSARDIIREMEARSKSAVTGEITADKKTISGKFSNSSNRDKDEEIQSKNNVNKIELEEKPKMKKEDERKRNREEEKKRKEEERRKKEEEKRKHEEEKQKEKEERRKKEEDKKKVEEEEKARKKAEDEIKKREQANNLLNKKIQSTPTNKKFKTKKALLEEIAKISPSAKRAIPVLSKLSPELDKENEKSQQNSVATAVGEAAMLLMATPLLIDRMMPKKNLSRTGSWLTKGSGRVRDVVQRYNTLNDMKPLINSMNGNATPLKRPRDRVDGPEENPRKLITDEVNRENEDCSGKQKDSSDVKPTPPSQKKKILQMKEDAKHLVNSPSLERLKIKLQDYENEDPFLAKKDSPASNMEKSTVDFNSPVWQKTPIAAVKEFEEKLTRKAEVFAKDKSVEVTDSTSDSECVAKESNPVISETTEIAVVTEESDEKKENNPVTTINSLMNEKVTRTNLPSATLSRTRRRSSVLPTEQMEEKLENLLNSATAQKAWESIKYMIFLFKQMQRHPNEEKYHRIFKGRVKFRKNVWTMRNAKLFMTTSGWTEVGSFIIFPLSKKTDKPLLLLNKYLSILEESRPKDQNGTAAESGSNLRRTSSSDLVEKIMELKEAFTSSRSNSHRTRRISIERNSKLRLFRGTMSTDEVNTLSRTSEECTPAAKDSTCREDQFQRPEKPLRGEKHQELSKNLRRSVSESALYTAPENSEEHTSLIVRRFSQRGVTEQPTICDLDMENPVDLKTTVAGETGKEAQQSTSLLTDVKATDLPKNDTPDIELYPDRQTVRSPNEVALEEADKLSSVLGNMLDTLGSSTDSERESDSEKELQKAAPGKAKIPKTGTDQYKDDELEALCETLDLIIRDNTSESSSDNGNDVNSNAKRYNLRKSSFKPQTHAARRTTQQLGKTKSLDSVRQLKQKSTTNGNLDRERRVIKAKSIDVYSATNNRKSQQKLSAETRQNKPLPQSSIKTRAQRQREWNKSRTQEASNRNQIAFSKQESVVSTKPPAMKRAALRAKSVDINKPRTRLAVAKSKSVGNQGMEHSRLKTRPSRSSSSEDDKKAPGFGDEKRSVRSCGKETNRASALISNNTNRRKSKACTKASNLSKDLEPSKGSKEHPDGNEESRVNTEAAPKFESEQVVSGQDETDSYSHPVESSKAGREKESAQGSTRLPETEDVSERNQKLQKRGGSDATEGEKRDEIVSLSKEIQFHYSESFPQPNGDVGPDTAEPGRSDGQFLEVKQCFSITHQARETVDQDNELPVCDDSGRCCDGADSVGNSNATENALPNESTQTQPNSRKMTLLDIGKQQSRERSARKDGDALPLSLEERKQLILESAVTKPKSKPADKRRSILQIKNRNDGNLVKYKKDAYENVTHTAVAANCSVDKSTVKRRHFRFRGRGKKSFEFSNERLDAVPEDNEAEVEEKINDRIPPLKDGQKVDVKVEEIEKNVEKEKIRSPIKISPLQLRFTKRRGFYDVEKRANAVGVGSPEQCFGEYDC